MLEPGATLQRGYTIERILGRGGMGAVYLARHATLGRRVAIKETVLRLEHPEDQARASEQFRQEAEILASLEHPNLVDVKDFFEEDGSWFLVMSFVDGSTLETIVNDAPGPLPVDQVLDWAVQVAEVLIYLHEHEPPVIVRDLKPNNIMLDAKGRIRVIDFGIARVYEAGSETSLFVKGAGTVGFAPVEQFGGGTTDPRSDLYSLGATLYALLTRTLPPWSVSLATGEANLTPPAQLNPRITPALERLILQLMSLRKEHRLQTAREAKTALQALVAACVDDPAPHVMVPQRFCTACGATLLPASTTCPRCGGPLSGASGGLATPPSPPGAAFRPPGPPPQAPPQGPASSGGWPPQAPPQGPASSGGWPPQAPPQGPVSSGGWPPQAPPQGPASSGGWPPQAPPQGPAPRAGGAPSMGSPALPRPPAPGPIAPPSASSAQRGPTPPGFPGSPAPQAPGAGFPSPPPVPGGGGPPRSPGFAPLPVNAPGAPRPASGPVPGGAPPPGPGYTGPVMGPAAISLAPPQGPPRAWTPPPRTSTAPSRSKMPMVLVLLALLAVLLIIGGLFALSSSTSGGRKHRERTEDSFRPCRPCRVATTRSTPPGHPVIAAPDSPSRRST